MRHPLIGHAAIFAVFLVSVGVARSVYVAPRQRELGTLRAGEQRLAAELSDLQRGIQEMDGWARAHPGQDLWTFHARRALPARDMVAGFLRAIVPMADRHQVGTQLIQPAGALIDQTVSDASGAPITYRRAELRFRLIARYQDLGEYLKEVESMDQLVVVRSVSIQQSGSVYPELAADVTIWLFGTP